jgi:hypothetical protein
MIEDKEALPVLRDLAQLRADPEFIEDSIGAVLAIVPFDQPGRALRLNITMEESLVDSVDRAAKAAGQTRSAFLTEAARARLKGAA